MDIFSDLVMGLSVAITPMNMLPLSPMNTRAGCVLKIRKPTSAPASVAGRIATNG